LLFFAHFFVLSPPNFRKTFYFIAYVQKQNENKAQSPQYTYSKTTKTTTTATQDARRRTRRDETKTTKTDVRAGDASKPRKVDASDFGDVGGDPLLGQVLVQLFAKLLDMLRSSGSAILRDGEIGLDRGDDGEASLVGQRRRRNVVVSCDRR
jgi:hypothetical protein